MLACIDDWSVSIVKAARINELMLQQHMLAYPSSYAQSIIVQRLSPPFTLQPSLLVNSDSALPFAQLPERNVLKACVQRLSALPYGYPRLGQLL